MPWYVWVIGGLVLLGAEIFTGGFGVIWFGASAWAAGLAAAMGGGLALQLALFAGVGLALLIATRPLARRLQRGGVKTGYDAMVGRQGVVEQTVGDPAGPIGSVRVGGERWRATALARLEPGARVVIRQLEGVTLLVEPAAGPPSEEGTGS